MLAQKLIVSYTSRIFTQVIQIAASIIVARVAGPGVLGTISFGLAYVSMFSFVADLGFGTAHIKKLSEGSDSANCIATYARIKLLLVFFFLIAVVTFFSIQKYILHVSFESNDHILVIVIFLFTTTITQIYSIARTTFAGYTLQAKSDIPELIETFVNQIFRILIVLLGFGAVALALGNLFAVLLLFPIFMYLFKNYKFGAYDKALAKEYFKIALPVMLVAFTSSIGSSIDKVLLQFFNNSEQVGYYTAGFRIGGFVLLISNSIGSLFYPIFSKAASQKDFLAIKRQVDKFERFSFIYIMPVLILATLLAKDIVYLLLGKQFMASVPIMMMINIAMFIRVVNSPYSSVIVGLGYFNTGLKIGIAHFLFFILSLYILMSPSFFNLAGYGAALSILISNLFMLVLYMITSKKYLPILSHKTIIIYTLYGVLNYGIFKFILYKIDIFYGYFVLLFIINYIIVTYYSMYKLKLILKKDFVYINSILDIKSLKKYIKTEIII